VLDGINELGAYRHNALRNPRANKTL
jgi:hypothetical protein